MCKKRIYVGVHDRFLRGRVEDPTGPGGRYPSASATSLVRRILRIYFLPLPFLAATFFAGTFFAAFLAAFLGAAFFTIGGGVAFLSGPFFLTAGFGAAFFAIVLTGAFLADL